MQTTFYELAMWQERWYMENLPPLPLTTWVSPHYDPYEFDPSHYTDNYPSDYQNENKISYNNEINLNYRYESEHEPESDYSDNESDYAEDLY